MPDVKPRSACRKAEDPPKESSKKSEIHRKGSSRPDLWRQSLAQPDFLWEEPGWKRHQNKKGEKDEKEVLGHEKNGAGYGIRTHDLQLGKLTLYR